MISQESQVSNISIFVQQGKELFLNKAMICPQLQILVIYFCLICLFYRRTPVVTGKNETGAGVAQARPVIGGHFP
ncbi:MAG: hypothetical protein ACOYXC_06930, partial [Candidatus Rifleibacteriota bacterium]